MQLRKLITSTLLTATMIASMAVPAFADAGTTYPNLTPFDTDYTQTFSYGASSPQSVDFMVQAIDSNWVNTAFFSEAEADNIEWSVLSGSVNGFSLDYSMPIQMDVDEYISMAEGTISTSCPAGAAVVQAKNPVTSSTITFTALVDNPNTQQTVTGIKSLYYDSTTGNDVALNTTATSYQVSSNAYYGNTHYASVLDALKVNKDNGEVYSYYVKNIFGSYMIYQIAFDNTNSSRYPNVDMDDSYYPGTNDPGWQFRVYEKTGTNTYSLEEMSGNLSADNCSITDNDLIVWKYGTYSGVSFDDTITLN